MKKCSAFISHSLGVFVTKSGPTCMIVAVLMFIMDSSNIRSIQVNSQLQLLFLCVLLFRYGHSNFIILSMASYNKQRGHFQTNENFVKCYTTQNHSTKFNSIQFNSILSNLPQNVIIVFRSILFILKYLRIELSLWKLSAGLNSIIS